MHIPTFLKCFRNHDKDSRSEAMNDSRCLHRLSWKRWKKKKKENENQVFYGPHLEYLTDSQDQSEETISDFTEFFSEPETTRCHDTLQNTKPPLRSILRSPPPPSTDPEIEDLIIRSGKQRLWPIFSRPLPSRRPLPGTGEENIQNAVEEVDTSMDKLKPTPSTLPATFETGSCSYAGPHSKEELTTDSQIAVTPSGSDMDASNQIGSKEMGSSSQDASVVGSTAISTANATFPGTGKNNFAEADFGCVDEVGTVACSASSRVTSRPPASTQGICDNKDFNPSQSTLTQNDTAEVSSLGYDSKTLEYGDGADAGVVKSSKTYLEKKESDHDETGTSSETSLPSVPVPTKCVHDTEECISSQSSLKKTPAAEHLSLTLASKNPEGDDYVGLTVDTKPKTCMDKEQTEAEEYTVLDSDCEESALDNKAELKDPRSESSQCDESACAARDEMTSAGSGDVSEIQPVLPNSQASAVTCDGESFQEDDEDVSEIQPVLKSCEGLETTSSRTVFLREGEDLKIVVGDDTKISDNNNVEKNTEAIEKETIAVDENAEDVQTRIPNKRKKRVRFNLALPDPPPLGGFTLIDEDGVEHTKPNMMFTFPAKPSFKETAIAMRGTRFHERCEQKAVKASDILKRFFNSRRFKCVVRTVGPPLLLLIVGAIFLVVLL